MSKSTPVKESPLAIGALGLTRQFALRANKDTLAFQVAIDLTADVEDINDLMDTITTIIYREELKQSLVEKREALKVAREQPRTVQRDIDRLGVERAAYIAARQANRPGRRLDWKPSEKELKDLQQYEDNIRNAELSKKNYARDIPIIEWNIACLEARIAGREEPEKPPELDDAIDDLRHAA